MGVEPVIRGSVCRPRTARHRARRGDQIRSLDARGDLRSGRSAASTFCIGTGGGSSVAS